MEAALMRASARFPARFGGTLLAIALLGAAAPGAPAVAAAAAGDPAPTLSLVDHDGKTVPLVEGTTSLYFFAAWCAPCAPPISILERAAARHAHRGYRVLLVGVATREDEDRLREFARRRGFELTILFDRDGAAEKAYGVSALPYHVLIGAGGTIREAGPEVPQDLAARVAALLGETSP
jgi:peroxiredoxin